MREQTGNQQKTGHSKKKFEKEPNRNSRTEISINEMKDSLVGLKSRLEKKKEPINLKEE